MKKIYNAQDEIEAKRFELALEEAGICAFSRESGSGEYLKVSSGFSVFGRDIYVEDEKEIKAKEIIEAILAANEAVAMEEQIIIPWYKNKVILARILLVWCVVCLILVAFLAH